MSYLITSLGTYRIKNNASNRHPVVIVSGKENLVDIPEMILWSSAMFALYDTKELKIIFQQKCKQAGLPPQNFDECLSRCLKTGLMICSKNDKDMPPLEQIIFNVTAYPTHDGLLTKIFVFIKLIFINKSQLHIAKKVFQKPILDYNEKTILSIIKTNNNSVWMLFLEKIEISKHDFLINIVNLYLKKEIYFDISI